MVSKAAAFSLVTGLACSAALGQNIAMPSGDGRTRVTVAPAPLDPDSPAGRALAEQNRKRVELERELNKIRVKHFGAMRKTEIRQAGIARLREFRDPAGFPSLIKVFAKEQDDVRHAVLDLLALDKGDAGDASLAWIAVHDDSTAYRGEATKRLLERREAWTGNGAPPGVQSIIAEALKTDSNKTLLAAAQLAEALSIWQAIPMIAMAQVGSGPAASSGSGGDPGTSLAYILVGNQTAFVSNLTPVVGNSAVAFDPTVGVITEGVVLRVIDAAVITYRVEVHQSLVRLSSNAWGRSTADLGWDQNKWRSWWKDEFLPTRSEAERAALDAPRR